MNNSQVNDGGRQFAPIIYLGVLQLIVNAET